MTYLRHSNNVNNKYQYKFRITKAGYVAIGLILLLFVISLVVSAKGLYERVNLLYAMITVAFSMMIISVYIGFFNIKSIVISRRLPSGISSGEIFDVWVKVFNTSKFMPKFAIHVVDRYKNSQGKFFEYDGYCLNLRANKYANMLFSMSLVNRGLYEFDEITFESSFPFGLIKFSTKIRIHDEILIYPKIAKIIEKSNMQTGIFSASQMNMKTGKTFHDEYFGVREWNPGDSLKFIHWKLSAKTQELQVREYLEESFPPVLLILDSYVIKEKDFQALESAISVIAGFARAFSLKGWRFGVLSENLDIDVGSGHKHYLQILKNLAMYQPSRQSKSLRNVLESTNLKKYRNHIAITVCLRDLGFYDFSNFRYFFKSFEAHKYRQLIVPTQTTKLDMD